MTFQFSRNFSRRCPNIEWAALQQKRMTKVEGMRNEILSNDISKWHGKYIKSGMKGNCGDFPIGNTILIQHKVGFEFLTQEVQEKKRNPSPTHLYSKSFLS